PDNLKARVDLAGALNQKVDKSLKEERQIFDLYESVLRAQPDNQEIRGKLVDLAIAAKRYTAALSDLEILLKEPGAAGNGELEQLAALCHACKREKGPATELYRKAIAHAPHLRASYVELRSEEHTSELQSRGHLV